jgi:GTPase KRas protein
MHHAHVQEYSAMRDQYMRHGQGFICVYDITSRQSFNEIIKMRSQILKAKDVESVPMVLVGNKVDLEEHRQVTISEAKDLARSYSCEFIETSAKTGLNISESFHALVRCIRNEIAKPKATKKHKNCRVL